MPTSIQGSQPLEPLRHDSQNLDEPLLGDSMATRVATGSSFSVEGHRAGPSAALAIGFVNCLVTIPATVAFANIIFVRPFFRGSLPLLQRLVLLSSAVHQLCFTMGSSLPFAIGQVQDIGLIFLMSIASAIVDWRDFADTDISDNSLLAFVLVSLAAATLCTGCILVVIGRKKLSQYVQLLPLPAVGGYLAFIGFFLLLNGIGLVSGVQLVTLTDVGGILADSCVLAKALLGMGCGGGLYFVATRFRHPMALPGAMLTICLVFFTSIFVLGWTLKDARNTGWLPLMPQGHIDDWAFWRMFRVYDLPAAIDTATVGGGWRVIMRNWVPSVVALTFVVAFGSSLDIAAIASSVTSPVDYDFEMVTVGKSNVVAGVCGGFTGSYIFSATLLTMRRDKSGSRIPGIAVALAELIAVALPAEYSIVLYMPTLLFGSVMVFIGVDLCNEWLLQSRHIMSAREFGEVWVSFLLIVHFGLEVGFLLSVCISSLGFAYLVAQQPVTDHVHGCCSRTHHNAREQEALFRLRFRKLHLRFKRGCFVFFGSAMKAAEKAVATACDAERMETDENGGSALETGVRFLVLDFTGVEGVDATAAKTLKAAETKLKTLPGCWTLRLAGASPSVARTLCPGSDDAAHLARTVAEISADATLEECDELLLAEAEPWQPVSFHEMLKELVNNGVDDASMDTLAKHFQPRHFDAGETIFAEGDEGDFFAIIEQGAAESGPPVFIRFGAGSSVGDLDYSLGRTRRFSMTAGSSGAKLQVFERSAQTATNKELVMKLLLRSMALTTTLAFDMPH
eukprot:CAMPEP_0172678022 /NCGR_PEP_ID=MMETSP1074-20121228/15082_1 /TAXON_ID=2916 /ORGANISM="Ceratium fusus, Strain PA161109" /LENGTH=791 /DNA_ID=CAMNT_0013495965 /DNA_START=15 /DNA_END=2390 /DNA_ORIENTATION=-